VTTDVFGSVDSHSAVEEGAAVVTTELEKVPDIESNDVRGARANLNPGAAFWK